MPIKLEVIVILIATLVKCGICEAEILNLHSDIYRIEGKLIEQRLVDQIYETIERNCDEYRILFNKLNWKNCIDFSKNTEILDYGIATKINKEESNYRFEIKIINNKFQYYNFYFLINEFFINKFIVRESEINFNVFLRYFLVGNKNIINKDLLKFSPLFNSEISTYTHFGGAISDLGIDKMSYEERNVNLFTIALVSSNGESLELPYDENSIKEFLFKKLINKNTKLLSKSLKGQLLDYSEQLCLAFDDIKKNSNYYTSYLIRYVPEVDKAQIMANIYLSYSNENKEKFDSKELDEYISNYKLNLYKSHIKKSIDTYFDNAENLKTTVSNDKLLHIYTLDTGEIIKNADNNVKKEQQLNGIIDNKDLNYIRTAVFSNEFEVYGYGSGNWKLTNLQKYIIEKVVDFIKKKMENSFSKLKIKIYGYTDSDRIKHPYIKFNYIGNNKLYYSDCNNDKIIEIKLGSNSQDLKIMPEIIKNNCQLSFLRAIVFAEELSKKIENPDIYYWGLGELKYGDKYYNRKTVIKLIFSKEL